MSDLDTSLGLSAAGMRAQGTRLRVISENLANADSLAKTPGGEPYRRKMVTFGNVLDSSIGAESVQVKSVVADGTPFEKKLDPSNPAADSSGYVQMPNVNPLLEISDMREAQRSYQANLAVIETAKSMMSRTIDILRS